MINAFRAAFTGLAHAFYEKSVRIEFVEALVVVGLGIFFQLSRIEWMMVVFAIGMVLTAEVMNSAVEELGDFVHSEQHPNMKRVKDISAASVLVAVFTALAIGLFVFVPHVV